MTESPNIMSIRELIDTAFGEAHSNVVHHKLIQTVLIILARQLRLLERRVEIEIGPFYDFGSATSLSVTEIKMHANVPRKKKHKQGETKDGGGRTGTTDGRSARTSTDKHKGSKVGADGKSSKYGDTSTSSGDKSSSITKSGTDKSATEKASGKYTEKTGQEKSSARKTSIEMLSTDKSLTDKSSTDPTSTDKSSSDKTKTSTDKSSAAKSSTDKSSSDKTTTETSDKTTTGTSDKTTTETSDKTTTGTSDKTTTETSDKTTSGKTTDKSSSSARADSREEYEKTPSPMASMDSMEKQYEKLLIVQRVPTEESKQADGRTQMGTRSAVPRLSIVTQEEFEELVAAVRDLQRRYIPAGTAGFPENAQLLNDLRKGASLTDAMAALQLSVRIEAAEKALEKMLSLVTDLASIMPGANIKATAKKSMATDTRTGTGTGTGTVTEARKGMAAVAETRTGTEPKKETEVIFGADSAAVSRKQEEVFSKSQKSLGQKSSKESIMMTGVQNTLGGIEASTKSVIQHDQSVAGLKVNPDWITADELDTVIQDLYDNIIKTVNTDITRSNNNANNALRISGRIEEKLNESLDLGDRMSDLETLVSDYADQITTLDTGLSSQMTNYQEQLTQMQHDLEAGVETMQEALANTGGDTAAVAELNNHFTNLQSDFDIALMRQKQLRDIQDTLSIDIQSLWKQIEILRDTKSDRDEVADALRDKAGLAALNGLVSRLEFDAVRGDFEIRIGAAYKKFNNQEMIWQKAIDELLRELSEKADYIQVISLQDSIARYLDKFNSRIHAMMEIVGEPRAAAISKKMFRDTACLSCATPAHLDMAAPKVGPSIPRFSATGDDGKRKRGDDGDHGVCYPGFPVPHPVDSRAHLCNRFCGGSHTMLNKTISRVPPNMIISTPRQVSTAVGSDGRTYMVDETINIKPCKPCNVPKVSQLEADPAPELPDELDRMSSGMTPPDYRVPSAQLTEAHEESIISATALPPEDED